MIRPRLRVAITGASGFIGTRLAEILYLRFGIVATSIVRSYNKAARLARIESDLRIADLGDPARLEAAVGDAEVLIHTAYDAQARDNNVVGLENIAAICVRRNIRLVHVSSFASYGPAQDGDLTEAKHVEPCGFAYADLKLMLERRVIELCAGGLNGIVLQPTIVYGPFGGAWTDVPVEQLQSNLIVLPRNGEGFCNAVYVDDVCQALLRAADPGGVRGRKYIVSAAAPVTWAQFYRALQEPLGTDSLRLLPDAPAAAGKAPLMPDLKQAALALPKRLLAAPPIRRALVRAATAFTTPEQKERLRALYTAVAGREAIVPDSPYRRALFSAKCHARIDAAAADLGYRPEFDFARGMALTAEYVRWAYCAGHLDRDSSRLSEVQDGQSTRLVKTGA